MLFIPFIDLNFDIANHIIFLMILVIIVVMEMLPHKQCFKCSIKLTLFKFLNKWNVHFSPLSIVARVIVAPREPFLKSLHLWVDRAVNAMQ